MIIVKLTCIKYLCSNITHVTKEFNKGTVFFKCL
jgi:hypothetical protein